MSPRVLTTLLLLSTLPALAAGPRPTGNASDWIRAGERAYASGKYVEAAEALKKAHALEPHPRLLYNIARAYDQAVDTDSALEYYQLYLSANEGTDPILLRRSALAIDRLRLAQAKNQAEVKDQALERTRLTAEAEAAKRRADQEAEEKRKSALRQAELEAEVSQMATKRNRILAFVAAGVGAAGVATTVVMGLNALSSVRADAQTRVETERTSLIAAARTQALVADIGLGVGVAGAVTAYLLYPKGGAAEPAGDSAQVTLVPTFNGVGVVGRF